MALFLTSYALLRVLLFTEQGSNSSSHVLVYAGLLSVGLVLSVDTVLTPLWAAATHRDPSGASLVGKCVCVCGATFKRKGFVRFLFVVEKDLYMSPSTATILVTVGMFTLYGLSADRDKGTSLSLLPHGLFIMATLTALLQPEFNLGEVNLHISLYMYL